MTEFREVPKAPPDRLTLTRDGQFNGAAYVYRWGDNGFQPVEVKFNVAKGDPLSPFFYNKPIPDGENPTGQPERFERDKNPREGNYPLAYVSGVRRPPNHLYEDDNGIVTAVEVKTPDGEGKQWQTRYYPKGCLEPETWEQALATLGITEE